MRKRWIQGTLILVLVMSGFIYADFINITVADGKSSWSSWYKDKKYGYKVEDNEVEPGNYTGQAWDMEAFFLEGTELSMMGGFNLESGTYGGFDAGDVFLDIDNDAVYDFVLDMDYENNTYSVVKIDETAVLENSFYAQNSSSDPWQYVSGGTVVEGLENLSFDVTTVVGNYQGYTGTWGNNTHYIINGLDLAFLGNTNFTAHFTMECGNDNLMGKGSIAVPEPSTFSLLFLGITCLIGFGVLRRKKLLET